MCAASNPNRLPMNVSTPAPNGGANDHSPLPVTLGPPGESARQLVGTLVNDRRLNPRLPLQLPICVCRVTGNARSESAPLISRDISTMGVYFESPQQMEKGASVELDVALVDRPLDRGCVRLSTRGQVVRVGSAETPGWHGLAVRFDELSFHYDDKSLPRPH